MMQINRLMQHTEFRLKVWGKWANKAIIPDLGYPKSNTVARLLDTGGILAVSTNKLAMPINTNANEIEEIVKGLLSHGTTMHLGLVLRAQYIAGGSIEQKAKLIKISPPQFSYYLNIARHRVANRLARNRKEDNSQPAVI